VLLDIIERIVVLAPGGIVMDGPRDAVIGQLRRNAPPPAAHKAEPRAVAEGATGSAA